MKAKTIAGLMGLVLATTAQAKDPFEAFATAQAIQYKDEGTNEYWQTSRETEELGTGDCEDKALYFIDQLDEEYKTNTIFRVGIMALGVSTNYHAWVEMNLHGEKYIVDPTNGTFANRGTLFPLLYVPIVDWDTVPAWKKASADRRRREENDS